VIIDCDGCEHALDLKEGYHCGACKFDICVKCAEGQKKEEKPKKVREPIVCYNCDKEGHIGRDCTEKKA